MRSRLATAAFCLLFAIPFGGVGVGAAWAMATMVYDGMRAKDWVLVKATVSEGATPAYHYAFEGKGYSNDRLGTMRIGGTSNVDDFDDRVASILARGREGKRPITVWVNPENPAESMVDRDIRWMLFVFLVPFAIAFGGVGLGALWLITKVFREPGAGKRKSAQAVSEGVPLENSGNGLGGLWFMAIMWNAISFPIAALAIPDALADGDWAILLVLIFPLIGLLLLWGALAATVGRLRRGKVSLRLTTSSPRVGSPVEGYLELANTAKAGEAFHVKLVCERTFRNGSTTSTAAHWTGSATVKARQEAAGMRVPFSIDSPSHLPASDSDADEGRTTTYRWRIEAQPASQRVSVPYRHEIHMERSAFVAPAPAVARAPARIDAGLEQVLGRFNPTGLTAEQRQAFAQLTAEQQQKLGKVLAFMPSGRKIVIAIVCIWVAVEFGPMIYSLVR